MAEKLTLKRTLPFKELAEALRKITFRGLYDKNGGALLAYRKARFSLATVSPARTIDGQPTLKVGKKQFPLFSPQPTIYQNQIEIIKTVDKFLARHKRRVTDLREAVEYDWKGRGVFHMLPPIIEKHFYDLKNGFVDLDSLSKRFRNCFIKDARGGLHALEERFLNDFYLDEISRLGHLDMFHSNAPLINYGLQYSGPHDFYIVCDGSHRLDYALETLGKPITVILVEPETRFTPYYAFPTPFRPTIRLSSKRSERMYPRLERDKIHLFNDFIKKVLHYDWSETGLNVSGLRSNIEVY